MQPAYRVRAVHSCHCCPAWSFSDAELLFFARNHSISCTLNIGRSLSVIMSFGYITLRSGPTVTSVQCAHVPLLFVKLIAIAILAGLLALIHCHVSDSVVHSHRVWMQGPLIFNSNRATLYLNSSLDYVHQRRSPGPLTLLKLLRVLTVTRTISSGVPNLS